MAETNSTQQLAISDYYEYKASVLVWKICSPILIIFGTIGNLMSILVLTRSSMRKSTMSIYLIVLSVMDIIVLYTGLLRQVIRYFEEYDLRTLSPLSCQINTWIVYFSLDMSVWILVAVTAERIISVWYPHSVRNYCNKLSSFIIITIMAIILLVVNSHFLYGLGNAVQVDVNMTTVEECVTLWDDYGHFIDRVWPWMDMCIFCIVPFCVLILGNISIIVKVCTAKMKRSGTSQQLNSQDKKTSSMTAVLLTLNFVFLICTSPISVYLIGEPYWMGESSMTQDDAKQSLIWAVVNMFMYTNNCIHFILYCLSGTRFREELKDIFRRKHRIRPVNSTARANDQELTTY